MDNSLNKVALIFKERTIPYNDLFFYVNALKKKLTLKNGDRVIICLENRPEWIISLFALWERGCIVVPVDYLSTPKEISHIINDSEPDLLVYSNTTTDKVKEAVAISDYKNNLLCIDDVDFNTNTEDLIPDETRFDINKFQEKNLALLIYTSGTTGLPKGAMLSFGNLKSNITCIKEAEIALPCDKVLAFLPFHHSYPMMVSLLVPISIGATIVIIDKITKEEIFSSLNKHNIDLFIAVPRIYELFHKTINEKLASSSLLRFLFGIAKSIPNMTFRKMLFNAVHKKFGGKIRYFVSGGAKLNPEIIEFFGIMGFKFLEGYGLTETSPVICFNRPDASKSGSAGKVLNGVTVKIEDEEIWVKGENVMKGYWRNEEKTRDAFSDEWFKTGDTGYLDDEGFLFITGRKKDIIVLSTGKNINPEDIESQLIKISSFIKEVAVIAENDRLKALIFPDTEALKQEKVLNINEKIKWDIIDVYNRNAPGYRKISGFEILKEELPKTRLGKIKRFLLVSKKEEKAKIQEKSLETEPDDDEYYMIRDFLMTLTSSKVLPSSHIEIDLALDSLDKVELLSFVETKFGISIKEDELSEIQLVKDIYTHIKRKNRDFAKKEDISWSKILEKDIEIDIKETPFYIFLFKSIISPLFKTYFQVKIEGAENIPESPFIIAPNHQSYFDAFFIIVSLPPKSLEHTYFIASDVCFETKIRKELAKRFHTLVINKDINLRESLQKSATILRRQHSIVIFPEGSITRDGNVQEFKTAFAILAKELNIPVVPVRINGLFELYKIFEMKYPRRGKIGIKYMPVIKPEGLSADAITQKVYKAIKGEF